METKTDDVFKRPYYWLTTRMLLALGVWPFQSKSQKRVRRCVVLVLVFSIGIPQLIKFFESLNDMEIWVVCIPMLGLYFAAVSKFTNWSFFHQDDMRRLALCVKRDWSNLKSDRDLEILDDYCQRGRKLTSGYACTETMMFGLLALYLSSPSIPKLLDFVLPLNESRPHIFLYEMEYFIDQDEHYVEILLHAYFTVPVALACIVFADNFFASFVHHACGMFEILKSKLERVHLDEAGVLSGHNYEKTLRLLSYCIDLQTDTIEFVQMIESSYTMNLLFLVGGNMVLITLTGFVIILKLDQPAEVLRIFAFNFGSAVHLFYSSWQGHVLSVQSESVYRSAYQGQWYLLDLRLQRMLIPIMVRSQEPCVITAGKLYVMSMESFSAVLRACLSFFTMLSSVR